MKYYLLTCGHVKSAKDICHCERCNCSSVKTVFKNAFDGLEGRTAKCKEKSVKSRWDLPGFVYQPQKDYDLYLYGK